MTAQIEVLAILGWPLLPTWWCRDDGSCACGKPPGACKPGKHPLGPVAPNGLDNATTDLDTIRVWFKQYPRANLAVRTGPEFRPPGARRRRP